MTCKPCRVTVNGTRYQVESDGTVRPTHVLSGVRVFESPLGADDAKTVRAEAARQRRNRNSRERSQAMRDLGLVKTPYGWE